MTSLSYRPPELCLVIARLHAAWKQQDVQQCAELSLHSQVNDSGRVLYLASHVMSRRCLPISAHFCPSLLISGVSDRHGFGILGHA